jgi:hypothetical protein
VSCLHRIGQILLRSSVIRGLFAVLTPPRARTSIPRLDTGWWILVTMKTLLPVVALVLFPGAVMAADITLLDPIGDDDGPGTYRYPTDAVYKAGSFDLTKLEVKASGDTVEFTVSVASRIEDPWDSKAWGGNGF